MIEIEEVPEEVDTEKPRVSHPPGKTPQCEAMTCPNATSFCRVTVKSLPPRFEQVMKTDECLSENLKVLKSMKTLIAGNGEFVDKTITNIVSYYPEAKIPFGDFFANS